MGRYSGSYHRCMEQEGRSMIIEQGVDSYGAEYKRTTNDFRIRLLEQDNCVCSVCHGIGAKIELRYVTRNYESAIRRGKICKNLQAHGHTVWICPKCIESLDNAYKKLKEEP